MFADLHVASYFNCITKFNVFEKTNPHLAHLQHISCSPLPIVSTTIMLLRWVFVLITFVHDVFMQKKSDWLTTNNRISIYKKMKPLRTIPIKQSIRPCKYCQDLIKVTYTLNNCWNFEHFLHNHNNAIDIHLL